MFKKALLFSFLIFGIYLLLVQGMVRSQDIGNNYTGLQVVSRMPIYSVDDQTPPPHNEVHFPFLYESHNGAWYMTHRQGPHYRAVRKFGLTWDDPLANLTTDDRVQTVMSPDQGKTWYPWPGLPYRVRDLRLCVTKLSDGSLVSYISKIDSAEEGQSAITSILRSFDDGRTWSRHDSFIERIPPKFVLRASMWGSIIEVFENDKKQDVHSVPKLMVTYYGQNGELVGDDKPRYLLGLLQSHDLGLTWNHLAIIADSDIPGEEGPNEADILQVAKNEFIAVFRTGDDDPSFMHLSRSTDNGKTWSHPVSLPGGKLGVCPQLLDMDNGIIVLCYGTRESGKRSLWARLSYDQGQNWEPPLKIYSGEGKVYPDVQKLDERQFRVVYDESPALRSDGSIYNAIVRLVLRLEQR